MKIKLPNSESYTIDVACTNCHRETQLEVPKGRTVRNELAVRACGNCGTFSYRQTWKPTL